MYKVKPCVYDHELEAVLNNGLVLVKMFRNAPGIAGRETTTVVQKEDDRWATVPIEAEDGLTMVDSQANQICPPCTYQHINALAQYETH